MSDTTIKVEVAYGTPGSQQLMTLEVPAGCSIAEAIRLSGLPRLYPSTDFSVLTKGVWGQPLPDDHVIQAGDRVEVYRPLVTDPKTARRVRAGKS